MEEMFELAFAAVAIIIGIIAKTSSANKKKAEKKKSAPVVDFSWEDLHDKLEEALGGKPEKTEPEIPYAAPAQTVQTQAAPVVSVPEPVMYSALVDIESGSMVDPDHPEGCHAVEGNAKEHAATSFKPEKKPEEPIIIAPRKKNAADRRVIPGMTCAGLRQAVIMTEVLGKPVALRRAARR